MDQSAVAPNLDEARAQMAAILGLSAPVDEAVLRAAVVDPTYAHNLLVCREEPDYMAQLLANPPKPGPQRGTSPMGTKALARSAAESLMRWARTGFSTVSDAVFRRRLDACAACPHLKAPPEHPRALYALAGAEANRPSVCGQCGCVVSVKARRTSDTCPDADPQRPGFNRWSEPIAAEH